MGASGDAHAPGTVPDPGPTPGTVRFLREDADFSQPTAAGVINAASVIAANTFGPGQTFTNGITIGTVSTGGGMQFISGALFTGSTSGGFSVLSALQASASRSGFGIQASSPEAYFNLTTVQSAVNYLAQMVLETTPANFLDPTNTIEYQVSVKKGAGTPPVVLALGNNVATVTTTVKIPAANLITGAFSGAVPLAKLTVGGANGSLTVLNGLITAVTNPT